MQPGVRGDGIPDVYVDVIPPGYDQANGTEFGNYVDPNIDTLGIWLDTDGATIGPWIDLEAASDYDPLFVFDVVPEVEGLAAQLVDARSQQTPAHGRFIQGDSTWRGNLVTMGGAFEAHWVDHSGKGTFEGVFWIGRLLDPAINPADLFQLLDAEYVEPESEGPFVKHSFNLIVPEPDAMVLLASGLLGLVSFRWRRKKQWGNERELLQRETINRSLRRHVMSVRIMIAVSLTFGLGLTGQAFAEMQPGVRGDGIPDIYVNRIPPGYDQANGTEFGNYVDPTIDTLGIWVDSDGATIGPRIDLVSPGGGYNLFVFDVVPEVEGTAAEMGLLDIQAQQTPAHGLFVQGDSTWSGEWVTSGTPYMVEWYHPFNAGTFEGVFWIGQLLDPAITPTEFFQDVTATYWEPNTLVERSFTMIPVPEPGTMVLLASGLLGLASVRWRRKKKSGNKLELLKREPTNHSVRRHVMSVRILIAVSAAFGLGLTTGQAFAEMQPGVHGDGIPDIYIDVIPPEYDQANGTMFGNYADPTIDTLGIWFDSDGATIGPWIDLNATSDYDPLFVFDVVPEVGGMIAEWGSLEVQAQQTAAHAKLVQGDSIWSGSWVAVGGRFEVLWYNAQAGMPGTFEGVFWAGRLLDPAVNPTDLFQLLDAVYAEPRQPGEDLVYHSFNLIVPEPGTMVLLASGLLGLVFLRWRCKRKGATS